MPLVRSKKGALHSVHNAIQFFQKPNLAQRLLDEAGDRLDEASLTMIAKRYVSHPELQTGTIAFLSDVLLVQLAPDVARQQHQPLLDQLLAFNADTETAV